MSTPPTLNGFRAISVHLIIPYRGVWVADVELDLDLVATAPTSGPAILSVGGSILKGTIDPRGSSTFVGKASARIIGGGAGWDNVLPPQQFHIPAGVTSTAVYSATAAAVLETVVDPTPSFWGPDFIRMAGPASRVFLDRQWYVNPTTGITTVAPWLPAVLDPSATIIDWDPTQQRAQLTADALILPGTVLVDPRFNGTTYNVTDVEQVFDASGSTAHAWCSQQQISRLQSAMGTAIRELARTTGLATYTYRFAISESTNTVALQAVTPGAPDLNPVDLWTGMAGVLAQIDPASSLEIIVAFTADNPPQPYIESYSPRAIPLKLSADASLEVDVGPSAPIVRLAGGTTPLVLSPWALALEAALATFAAALASAATVGQVASAGTALGTSLSALPTPATVKTEAA